MSFNKKNIISSLIIASTFALSVSDACTRAIYLGDNNNVITGRSMDWKNDVGTNLWILPRGIQQTGVAGPNSIQWTSKYGSVIASGYDISTTDGINEKGLAVNLLWLAESQYPTPTRDKPTLSISIWGQYVLDNFATVAEAVQALENEPFTVVTDKVPGEERAATLHLAMSDASGDSAIIEYVDGKQVIYHNREYQVLTNSPTFDQQLAIDGYWKKIGGTTMLPGTNRAADRFARASFYINAIPKDQDKKHAMASVLSVMRNVSVPYGLNTEEEPNISSTRWRTVVDHKDKIYLFDSTLSPSTFWVNLNEIDFSSSTGKVKKLNLGVEQTNVYAGDVTNIFTDAPMFKFLGIN